MKSFAFVVVVMMSFAGSAQEPSSQVSEDHSQNSAVPSAPDNNATPAPATSSVVPAEPPVMPAPQSTPQPVAPVPVPQPTLQPVAPAPPVMPQPAISPESPTYEKAARWRFAVGLGYTMTSKLKFDSGYATSASGSGDISADMNYKNATVISAEARFQPQNAWGFLVGLQVDGERELDGGTLVAGGTTYTMNGGSGASKIQVSNIYGNAAYRWEQFYLPFGLNLSSFNFTPAVGFIGTEDSSGGIGAQVGIGIIPSESFAFELYSRVLGVRLKTTSSSGTADYGYGYFSSILFQGKFIF